MRNEQLSPTSPQVGLRDLRRWAPWQHWHVPVSLAVGVLLWWGVVVVNGFPAFVLPAPHVVLNRLVLALQDGTLLRHLGITLAEVLLGLLLGMLIANLLGYAIARNRTLERVLAPYIVASQAIPVVAVAPLLVIWFGAGFIANILICALIVFFPILINTIVGLRSVPDSLYALMHSLRASRWQVLRMLELPAALPVIFGGLKIGSTLAVIGVVVGEFIGADAGLGFLIVAGRGQFDTPLVFVAVLMLVAIALVLYGLVSLAERSLLAWRSAGQKNGLSIE